MYQRHSPCAFYLARYIAHYMDWCIISTISIQYNGIPTGIPVSVADGPVDNGTGVPYIYIAPAAPTSKDLKHNASSSFSFSEAMSDYCLKKKYIAEFPKCARLTLAGKVLSRSFSSWSLLYQTVNLNELL